MLVEVPLGAMDELVVLEDVLVSVEVVEVSEAAGAVEVEASGTAGDMLETVVVPVSELSIVGVVDVELTKGGAFTMYVLPGCAAYSPTSRSPLGVSYRCPPVVWTHVIPSCVGIGAFGSLK